MTHLNYYLRRDTISNSNQNDTKTVLSMCRNRIFHFVHFVVCEKIIIFFSHLMTIFIVVIAGDAASECGTSYYSEYDPFDYLYSSGTQYSDPVYEAVIKIDRTPIFPPAKKERHGIGSNQTFDFQSYDDGERRLDSPFTSTPDWDEELADFTMISPVAASGTAATAPPLPPRNYNRQSSSAESANQRPIIDRGNKSTVDRLKVATKLYENVIENRTYDAELVGFFNMVNEKRKCNKNRKAETK